eukprot:Colp12_sorted_trinity150504_noHs@34422
MTVPNPTLELLPEKKSLDAHLKGCKLSMPPAPKQGGKEPKQVRKTERGGTDVKVVRAFALMTDGHDINPTFWPTKDQLKTKRLFRLATETFSEPQLTLEQVSKLVETSISTAYGRVTCHKHNYNNREFTWFEFLACEDAKAVNDKFGALRIRAQSEWGPYALIHVTLSNASNISQNDICEIWKDWAVDDVFYACKSSSVGKNSTIVYDKVDVYLAPTPNGSKAARELLLARAKTWKGCEMPIFKTLNFRSTHISKMRVNFMVPKGTQRRPEFTTELVEALSTHGLVWEVYLHEEAGWGCVSYTTYKEASRCYNGGKGEVVTSAHICKVMPRKKPTPQVASTHTVQADKGVARSSAATSGVMSTNANTALKQLFADWSAQQEATHAKLKDELEQLRADVAARQQEDSNRMAKLEQQHELLLTRTQHEEAMRTMAAEMRDLNKALVTQMSKERAKERAHDKDELKYELDFMLKRLQGILAEEREETAADQQRRKIARPLSETAPAASSTGRPVAPVKTPNSAYWPSTAPKN